MRHPPDPTSLLHAFLTAQYRVRLPDGEQHLVPGRPLASRIAADGTPWALLTAFNPGAEARGAHANRAAQSQLTSALRVAGHACWPGRNSDPQGGHREPSIFVLGIAAADADQLATRFGQCALLAGRVGEPVVLRILRARWPGPVVDTAFVHWVASTVPRPPCP